LVRPAIRYLILVSSVVVGGLLVLYGLFAFVYNGDGSGTTYVTIAGRRMRAHVVGAVSLALGAVVIASGLLVARLLRPGETGGE
jgi:hypothetical protein